MQLPATAPKAINPPAQNRMELPPWENVQHWLAIDSVQSVLVAQRRNV